MKKPCAFSLALSSLQPEEKSFRDLTQTHLWCVGYWWVVICYLSLLNSISGSKEGSCPRFQHVHDKCPLSTVRNELASWLCDKEAEGEQNSTRNSVSWRTAKSQAVPTQGHYCLSHVIKMLARGEKTEPICRENALPGPSGAFPGCFSVLRNQGSSLNLQVDPQSDVVCMCGICVCMCMCIWFCVCVLVCVCVC